MFGKSLQIIFAGLVLVIGGGVLPASAQGTWKCYTYYSVLNHPIAQGTFRIGAEIEKITKGRVKAQCHVGGELPIDGNSITPAVGAGVLDIASNGFISGEIPIGGMVGLPGLFRTQEELNKGVAVLKPYMEREFAKRGMVLLGYWTFPDQVLWSNKPINSIAELKGRTLRVQNAEQAEFAKLIGAIPITLATADVATALQRNTIQVVITGACCGGKIWRDQFTHALLTVVGLPVDWTFINKRRWDSLSPDEQKALREVVERESKVVDDTIHADTAPLLKEFAEKDKMTIIPANKADADLITKVMEPFWTKWAEERGPEVVQALKEVRAAIGH